MEAQQQDRQVLASACEWYAILNDESATEKDKHDWHRWIHESTRHQDAWARIEQLGQGFSKLDTQSARAALNAPQGMSRRAALKKFSVAAVSIVGTLFLAQSHYANQVAYQVLALSATYRTQVGQMRHFTLSDHSHLWLNTASAADVDFTATQRAIYLRSGELLLETAQDEHHPKRPLWVESAHGQMLANTAKFSVRSQFQETLLAVFSGQVEVINRDGQATRVKQGQQIAFDAHHLGHRQPAQKFRAMWTKNILLVDNWPLQDLVKELNRYYSGNIEVAPGLSKRHLVGAYSTQDIPKTLAAISQSLKLSLVQTQPNHWRFQSS